MLNTTTTAAQSLHSGSFHVGPYRYVPGTAPAISVDVHSVARVDLVAGASVMPNGDLAHHQRMHFYDPNGDYLGSVTMFLASPDAAIPCGEMPPYFGVETATVDPVTGESPF